METTENGDSSSLSIEAELDPGMSSCSRAHPGTFSPCLYLGLRERLKRIAREVNSRDSGVGRSKPPPVSRGHECSIMDSHHASLVHVAL